MDKSKLREIVQNGESSSIEFKAEISDTEKLAKEIVSLLNLKGGTVLIGVSDEGEIVGIQDEKTLKETVMNTCRDSVNPSIIPFYEKIVLDDKTVIVLTIPPGIDKPYCVLKHNRKTYYIRVGTTVREATRDELKRLYQASQQIHYDEAPVYNSSLDALDEKRLNEYFSTCRFINLSRMSLEEKTNILVNARLLVRIEEDKVVCSAGGILLFAEEPEKFLYQSGIQFVHYKGTDSSDELINRKVFNKTLPENIQDVTDALKMSLPAASKIEGIRREDEVIFPDEVIREAITNACIHRDYTILGAKIRVFLFDDKLVVRSPGLPPNTVTVENMKIGYAVHRNHLLIKFIHDYHFAEGLGLGIPFILRTMKKISGKEPEISIEGEETVITLFKKT